MQHDLNGGARERFANPVDDLLEYLEHTISILVDGAADDIGVAMDQCVELTATICRQSPFHVVAELEIDQVGRGPLVSVLQEMRNRYCELLDVQIRVPIRFH